MGKRRFIGMGWAALSVVLLASAGEAGNLRSWDQKLASGQRFVVLDAFEDEAVLDRESQLVWQRTPFSWTVSWRDAVYYCANTTAGGRKGWRLPEIDELGSLIDPSAPAGGPTLPANHPFLGVASGNYWSATPTVGTSSARAFSLQTGFPGNQSKDYSGFNFWCVRGHGGK